MKKLVLLLAFIVPMGIAGFSQADYTDAQMFGSKRPADSDMIHDFGQITDNVVSYEFTLKNDKQVDVIISSINAPEGVGVVLTNKKIQAGSEVTFLVYVYKDLMIADAEFEKNIIITTEYSAFGNIMKSNNIYLIEGNF